MTRANVASLLAGLVALAVILDLVRRRQLREKYAALWLIVGIGMSVVAVFPSLLDWTADQLGVADPPNLLFFVAILVMLVVIVQLSFELSRVEDHLRTLVEEVALLRGAQDGSTDLAAPARDADGDPGGDDASPAE